MKDMGNRYYKEAMDLAMGRMPRRESKPKFQCGEYVTLIGNGSVHTFIIRQIIDNYIYYYADVSSNKVEYNGKYRILCCMTLRRATNAEMNRLNYLLEQDGKKWSKTRLKLV